MPAWLRYPWSFPPSGLLLAGFGLLYLLTGLIGHDPWKSDDAVHIGVAYSMVAEGRWAIPHLAGEAYLDFPPLYYWVAAACGRAFAGVLPLHDGLRIASGLFTAAMLAGLASIARELYGTPARSTAVLLMLGTVGLIVHAHDAQPHTALLAGTAWAWAGIALAPRARLAAVLALGLGAGLGTLATGLLAPALALPLALLLPACSRHWRAPGTLAALTAGLVLAAAVGASWPLWLAQTDAGLFAAWWEKQLALRTVADQPPANLAAMLALLAWFAWPALPLAAWTLWRERRGLCAPGALLPLLGADVCCAVLIATEPARSLGALPFLLPLVLLATPAAGSLRRGAASALDWFAMMTFSVFAVFAWVGWSALMFGVPERLARQAARLEPGFVMRFDALAVGWAALVTLCWLWLMLAAPRAPQRGTVTWAAGLTVFWALLHALWLPWIDYGRSYRPVSASLAKVLPDGHGCIAARGLGEAQRASLHYFDGILTQREGSAAAGRCDWLLVFETGRPPPQSAVGAEWLKLWEDRRPGDRHEIFRLYRREPSAAAEAQSAVDAAGERHGDRPGMPPDPGQQQR